MALLKKISGPGISDLDRIVRLGYDQAKQVSGSDLEIGTAMSTSPEDVILSYAALNHAGVARDEMREVRDKTDQIFDIVDDFLDNKNLSGALYKLGGTQFASKTEAKNHARELLKQILDKTVKLYDDNSLGNAAQSTFNFRNQDLEGILYEKTGLNWDQLIEQLTQFNSLSRDSREFQRFVGYLAQNTTQYSMQKRAFSSEFGESQEWNPLLEKEVKGFASALGYDLESQTSNNGQLWNLLDTIVAHNTYDLAFDFDRSIEKLGNDNSLDSFIQGIEPSKVAGSFLSKSEVWGKSKAELVGLYAKLNHSAVTKQVMKETSQARRDYQNILKDVLGDRDKVDSLDEAEKLIDRLLETYIQKRWTTTKGETTIGESLRLYREDRSYANVLLREISGGRPLKKSDLAKMIYNSSNLIDDRAVGGTIEGLSNSSVRGNITKRNIQEELSKRAIGYKELKDEEITAEAQKYANALGYKIKENVEVGTVLGIIDRAMYQKSYNLSDDFKLSKPSSIVRP